MRSAVFFRPVLLLLCTTPAGAHLVQPSGPVPPTLSSEPPTLVGRNIQGLVMPVPLVHTHVEVDVQGLVAHTTVTQVYDNRSNQAVETTYIFPLPPQATVNDMEARVGGRVIRSVVQEKEQARHTFEAARQAGQRAALLEQQRPNIFTMQLTHLMPGDRMDVTLRYVEPLAWDSGRVRLTFPTVVAPRFIPAGTGGLGCLGGGMEETRSINPPVAPSFAGHDLSFTLHGSLGLGVAGVSSPTHALDVMTLGQTVEVNLALGAVPPNRDIVLDFELPRSTQSQSAMFVSNQGQDRHFMLVTYPPVERATDRRAPMDWLFVLDVSGSMQGTSMEQARLALLASFDRMRPGDRFNLVAYNHTYWAHAPAPVAVTADSVERARSWVRELGANGGTMLLPALEYMLRQPAADGMLRYVVVITDGDLGNEEEVLAGVRRNLGDARLFMVAVGSAPNHFLAQKMADLGRGTFTSIADVSDITRQMGTLLNKIEAPALSGVELTFNGAEVDQLYPARMPDVFMGAPVTVFGRIQGEGGTLVITGQRGTQKVRQVVAFDVTTAAAHPGISTLWARQVVDHLMDAYRTSPTEAAREKVQADIINHAIHHNLVTQFTSLVAVEERAVNEGNPLQQVQIPVEQPFGWTPEGALANPHGGTADTFLQLMALLLMTLGLAMRAGLRTA